MGGGASEAASPRLAAQLTQRWRDAECESSVGWVEQADWIRRVALDWPLLAAGKASGGLVVVDLVVKLPSMS